MKIKQKYKKYLVIISLILIISIVVLAFNGFKLPFSTVTCQGPSQSCSSNSDCCGSTYCDGGICKLRDFCVPGSNLLCDSPQFNPASPDDFFCDLTTGTKDCGSQGCELFGENARCVGDANPDVCTNGHKRCCSSPTDCLNDVPRNDGDVYTCSGGQWSESESCDMGCNEGGSTSTASCNFNQYYCVETTGCIFKSVQQSNCYETLQECQSKIGFCCKNQVTNYYTWRLGQCNSNENPSQGTSINSESCNNLNIHSQYCQTCEEFSISYLFGSILSSKKCTPSEGSVPGYVIGSFINYFLGFKVLDPSYPQNTTTCAFSLVKLILIPIVFIFVILFSYDWLQYFKSLKDKKKKYLRLFLSIFLAFLICYLIYTFFIIGIILFILALTLKFAIKRFLP